MLRTTGFVVAVVLLSGCARSAPAAVSFEAKSPAAPMAAMSAPPSLPQPLPGVPTPAPMGVPSSIALDTRPRPGPTSAKSEAPHVGRPASASMLVYTGDLHLLTDRGQETALLDRV